MTAQAEFTKKVFDQVFDGYRKVAESAVGMQQDLFKQWSVAWPEFPKAQPMVPEQIQVFQKQWLKVSSEVTRNFMEAWEKHYKAGVESLEGMFKVPGTLDPAELQQKIMELWQKNFGYLKELAEAQVKNFQTAMEKWTELAKKANP